MSSMPANGRSTVQYALFSEAKAGSQFQDQLASTVEVVPCKRSTGL